MGKLQGKRISAKEWTDLRRKTRKDSFFYWTEMATLLSERRPALSLKALVCGEYTNGFREVYWRKAKAEAKELEAERVAPRADPFSVGQ